MQSSILWICTHSPKPVIKTSYGFHHIECFTRGALTPVSLQNRWNPSWIPKRWPRVATVFDFKSCGGRNNVIKFDKKIKDTTLDKNDELHPMMDSPPSLNWFFFIMYYFYHILNLMCAILSPLLDLQQHVLIL